MCAAGDEGLLIAELLWDAWVPTEGRLSKVNAWPSFIIPHGDDGGRLSPDLWRSRTFPLFAFPIIFKYCFAIRQI